MNAFDDWVCNTLAELGVNNIVDENNSNEAFLEFCPCQLMTKTDAIDMIENFFAGKECDFSEYYLQNVCQSFFVSPSPHIH